MIVAAVLMMLASQSPAPADCASAPASGPDFMAIMSGETGSRVGSGIQKRLGGTIVDPPAPRVDIAPGTMAGIAGMDRPVQPYPVEGAKDARSHDESGHDQIGGTCSAGRHPA